MSELSDYLEEQLRMRDWSGKELARRAKVAPSSIHRMMHDDQDSPPGFAIVMAVAQALRTDPITLLRKAGLLPREPEGTSLERQMAHTFRQLPVEHQRTALMFVEYLFTQRGNLVPFRPDGQQT
jgi:transcriptional regulator with XRE-family HTH domain